MIKEEEVVTDEQLEAELNRLLGKVRKDRKPDNRGIMLLTAHLGSLMLRYSDISQQKLDAAELIFWLTHNGDGTIITSEHRTK
jgi:hypothetical protein